MLLPATVAVWGPSSVTITYISQKSRAGMKPSKFSKVQQTSKGKTTL